MKKHLNTLFVTTEGAYLAKSGQSVAVRTPDDDEGQSRERRRKKSTTKTTAEDKPAVSQASGGGAAKRKSVKRSTKLRLPLHNLEGIVAFGRVSASPQLLAAAVEAGLTVSFLSPRGRFRYAAVGYSPGNVLLRRAQYRLADDPLGTAGLVRSLLLGKLANSRTVLQRAVRDSSDQAATATLADAAGKLAAIIADVKNAPNPDRSEKRAIDPVDLGDPVSKDRPVDPADQPPTGRYPSRRSPADRLRGFEGGAAACYFNAFDSLLTPPADPDSRLRFTTRTRRPPLDAVNALLSFLYSLLTHDARSACEATGLDAAVGFLHRDRPGRPSLALDLIEELRPVLADRLACTLINRGQLAGKDFVTTASGAVHLTDAARRTVLGAWQKRKSEEVTHPYLGEKMTWGLVPHIQARLLARFLREELDAYPPFLWK